MIKRADERFTPLDTSGVKTGSREFVTMSLGIDYGNSFEGDRAVAVLIERHPDGRFEVVSTWEETDSVLRARRLAVAMGVLVLEEGEPRGGT